MAVQVAAATLLGVLAFVVFAWAVGVGLVFVMVFMLSRDRDRDDERDPIDTSINLDRVSGRQP